MTNRENERTAGGLAGKFAGKIKAAAGSVLGNDDLAREGRLQEAQSDAETQAKREAAEARQADQEAQVAAEKAAVQDERRRLNSEVGAAEREERIERDRQKAEQAAAADAAQRERAAEAAKDAQKAAAGIQEDRAEQERIEDARTAVQLEQEARRLEAQADAVDPETKS